VNVEPTPIWLVTQIRPPWSSMNFRHSVSPQARSLSLRCTSEAERECENNEPDRPHASRQGEDGWREFSRRERPGSTTTSRPPPLLPLGPQVQQLDLLGRHAGLICEAPDDIARQHEMRVGARRKSDGEATYSAGRS
jgi:hypothetical protein